MSYLASRKGIVLWLTAYSILLLAVTAIVTAWAIRHAMLEGPRLSPNTRDALVALATIPGRSRLALLSLRSRLVDTVEIPLFDRSDVEIPSWTRHFPEPRDNGFLLLSSIFPGDRMASVRLIEISTGRAILRWVPDWSDIAARLKVTGNIDGHSAMALRAFHPLLLADGSIIFIVSGWEKGALARVELCNGSPTRWVLSGDFHHSVELAEDEQSVWVGSVTAGDVIKNPQLRARLRDDSLAQVTLDGQLVQDLSFADLLTRNGLTALGFAASGVTINRDPFHINQISVAMESSPWWNKGDLLVSARHLSTVFLVNPGQRRISWWKLGPWMNQHSARFVDGHTISVFDNNIASGTPTVDSFMEPGGINRVWTFDFQTGQLSQPFEQLLSQTQPRTPTQGRAELLPDGGLFLEETDMGRHLRFSRGALLWSRVNDYNQTKMAPVFWARYLTAENVTRALMTARTKDCVAY